MLEVFFPSLHFPSTAVLVDGTTPILEALVLDILSTGSAIVSV